MEGFCNVFVLVLVLMLLGVEVEVVNLRGQAM